MTDLATLGIRVEGQEVVTADAQLDGLAAAAGKAETATERLASAARGNGAAMMTMNTAMRQQERVLGAARSGMGLTAREGLNLSRQFSDIGVTAAMGMNPLMIALQQGPQLLDIFQEKAIATGTTVRAAMAGTARSIALAMAPLLAILSPLAVGVAALAAGWALASRSITNSIGDVGKEMNLTEDQLERLKEKNIATTATMGDSWNALGTTIKEMFVSVFGDQLSWVDKQWNAFLDDLTANTGKEVDAIAGFFTGAYNVVRDTWKLLPRALGDAAVSAANAMITAMNGLIERSVAGVNRLRAQYNSLPAWMRNGQTAPTATAGQVGSLANPYAGGMSSAAETAASSYGAGVASRQGMSSRFMGAWRQNTRDTAEARITAGAGDAREKAAKNAKDAADAVERLVKVGDAGLAALNARVPEMIEPLRLIADEMRLIDGLAQDMASGLASAFGDSGAALGDLLTTMSGYQARLAEINLAEREYRLTAGQADRERSQAQIQNYGDMAAAARGFFEEGSDGYRALLAVEQVYRAFQLAGMVQSMIMGQQETASSVAGALTRGAANAAEGASKMFAMLGPFAFPAVAAMVALLVGLGIRGSGGGGSPGVPSVSDAGPSGTTDAVRAQGVREQASRAANAQALAQSVFVAVEFDDPMFRARVTKETAPLASAAYRGAVDTSRESIPAEQTQKANMTLRTGRR